MNGLPYFNRTNLYLSNDRIVVVTLLMIFMLGPVELSGLVSLELLHRISWCLNGESPSEIDLWRIYAFFNGCPLKLIN